MEDKNNIINEVGEEEKKEENTQKNIQNEKEEIVKNNIQNEQQEKNNIEIEKQENNNIQNEKQENGIKKSTTQVEIKKPIMSEAEYQNMIKKRKLMTKNSKYKPMKLLFGKQKKPLNLSNSVQITNPNINNTNIQINNYTTYLTTTESIKEEQYQNDGKTLMVENPLYYSMKKLDFKNKNEYLNKIMILYIKKINEFEDIFHFTYDYLSFIIKLFDKLCQPYISFLKNLFITRIKPNLKYFQNIIPIYQEFALQLIMIENNNRVDINNKESNLINSVKKMNITNADNLNLTSNNIQNIILNNPLYIKIDTIESKFNEVLSKMNLYVNKLIKRRDKFNIKYKNQIEPYFIGIKERLNNLSLFYEYLLSSRDFLFIEYYIKFNTNKIYNKISQFLINMDLLFKSSQNLFCDYLALLNNLVKSFYNDNKNVFNISSLLPKKLLINLDNIMKSSNIRKNIDKRFEFDKVIEHCMNFKIINEINHSLLNYRDNLIKYNYVKNDEIEEIINFNLIKYNSSENFIQFLMRLIPEKFMIKFNEMIELQLDIKKNSGIIKGYTNSLLIITYQGHIFLFDKSKKLEKNKKEEKESNNNKKMSRKEIINSIMLEDNKKVEINTNEKSDNNDLYEFIANDKLTDVYIRKNFGMAKLASNPNKKLMQFYENLFDFRQYKPIIVDLLSDDNMNKLINIISANKFL